MMAASCRKSSRIFDDAPDWREKWGEERRRRGGGGGGVEVRRKS